MSSHTESEALHARVRAIVHAFEEGAPLPESFDALACALARYQASHVPGYARLCSARGVQPASIVRAEDAPAVPCDAFKLASVFAFEDQGAGVVFRTSGTTGTTTGARGVHFMRDAGTYDAAALAFGRTMLGSGLTLPVPVLVVGPSERDAPDSSLARMTALFARKLGIPEPYERTFFVRGGSLDVAGFRARVAGLAPTSPVLVLATSFALVHLLDGLRGESLTLPPGSRVMQTGGFKGKSREVGIPELRRAVAGALAVDERCVVGEYGMTELSSQFWEATAVDARASHGVYREPPWARVVPVDGVSLAPVRPGEIGIARIEDLANVDSAFAIIAQDRVRRVQGGFELLGRSADAPPRGCSIAVDEMLSAEGVWASGSGR
ncbi:MAG: acyl-protein synthetase [Myxococcota bacterium]|nr:acyl-protein synthetase [Myxococcota bacterium]